jgi:hypothetical protein
MSMRRRTLLKEPSRGVADFERNMAQFATGARARIRRAHHRVMCARTEPPWRQLRTLCTQLERIVIDLITCVGARDMWCETHVASTLCIAQATALCDGGDPISCTSRPRRRAPRSPRWACAVNVGVGVIVV